MKIDKELLIFWAVIIAVFVGLVYAVWRDEQAFSKHLAKEHNECVASGESKYVCDAYTSSRKAERSAKIAASVATSAAVMSTVRVGR